MTPAIVRHSNSFGEGESSIGHGKDVRPSHPVVFEVLYSGN